MKPIKTGAQEVLRFFYPFEEHLARFLQPIHPDPRPAGQTQAVFFACALL